MVGADIHVDDNGRTLNAQEEIDEKFTRVTDILKPFNGLGHIDPTVLQVAANRGTRVHQACEAIVKGLGDWTVTPDIKGYIDSFMKWWDKGHKVLATERRFYCSELLITGQLDYIIEYETGPIILDLKATYRPSKTWPLQGSAYAYMAKKAGYDIKGIHFLQLSRHGIKPHLYIYDDHFELFKKCLDIYNHFYRSPNAKRAQ